MSILVAGIWALVYRSRLHCGETHVDEPIAVTSSALMEEDNSRRFIFTEQLPRKPTQQSFLSSLQQYHDSMHIKDLKRSIL